MNQSLSPIPGIESFFAERSDFVGLRPRLPAFLGALRNYAFPSAIYDRFVNAARLRGGLFLLDGSQGKSLARTEMLDLYRPMPHFMPIAQISETVFEKSPPPIFRVALCRKWASPRCAGPL